MEEFVEAGWRRRRRPEVSVRWGLLPLAVWIFEVLRKRRSAEQADLLRGAKILLPEHFSALLRSA
jgi:hypothetical protein